MAANVLLVSACFLATGSSQFVFQHGLHPHPPHPPPSPPAYSIGSPQFPRFSKCANVEAEGADADVRRWEWLQREYGCASLFASVSILSRSTSRPTTGAPATTQSPSAASSDESVVPDAGAKKSGPDASQQLSQRPEHAPSAGQPPRYRAHRAGGLFAGVGLSSDFYSGGFGRYSRIGAGAQQDPFAWRHAAPSDVRIFIDQPQRDALEDMTNERRRRDARTCAEFRVSAAKVVASGPLEDVCCNIICYCDELQNISGSPDRCGGFESPLSPKSAQNSTAVTTVRPSAASVIDAAFGRQTPETVQQQLTERVESNGTWSENGTAAGNASSGAARTVGPSTSDSTTSGSSTPKVSTPSTAFEPFNRTGAASPNESPFASLKKAQEMLSGGMAATVLASERARRPVWTPVMASGDNAYQPFAHRKSYQFGAPEEWGNFVHGDSSAHNARGKEQN